MAIIFSIGTLVYYSIPTHEQFYDGLWIVITKEGQVYHHVRIRTPKTTGVEILTMDGKIIYIKEYSTMEKE